MELPAVVFFTSVPVAEGPSQSPTRIAVVPPSQTADERPRCMTCAASLRFGSFCRMPKNTSVTALVRVTVFSAEYFDGFELMGA